MEDWNPTISRVVQMDELERSVFIKTAVDTGLNVEREDPTREDLLKITGREIPLTSWLGAFETVRNSTQFKFLRELQGGPK